MNDLNSLAKWWTSEPPARTHGLNRDSAPILAGLFDDAVGGYQMDPFMEDVDHRVVITLEKALDTATPLYRHTLINEISEAVESYRDTGKFWSLNSLAVFSPVIESYRKPSVFVEGLRAFDEFTEVNEWTGVSPDLLATAFTVVLATVKLDGTGAVVNSFDLDMDLTKPQAVRLRSYRVFEMLRDNPQRLHDIVDICEKYPFIDHELLVERLDSTEKALWDGML